MSKSAVHRSVQIAQLPANLKDLLRKGYPESKVLKLFQNKQKSTNRTAFARIEVFKYQSLASEIFEHKCKIKVAKQEINLCLSFKDIESLASFLNNFSRKNNIL